MDDKYIVVYNQTIEGLGEQKWVLHCDYESGQMKFSKGEAETIVKRLADSLSMSAIIAAKVVSTDIYIKVGGEEEKEG